MKPMNIKKLASLLFQRSVIVAALILVQAALIIGMLALSSAGYSYVRWGSLVLSVLAVLIIVSRQTDPGYKIAWIVPILLFPAFGWLLYLLCGGNKLSARQRRKMQGMDRTMLEQLEQDYKAEQLERLGADAANQARYLERYARCPVYTNTWTRYFPLGDDAFPVMLEELKKAEKYIFLEYFIIAPGAFWDSIVEILREKHAAGVDVRVIYDDMGCLTTVPSGFVIRLEQAHIRCIPFNPVVPLVSLVMNHRDHRKIVSIDGNVAYNGGTNFADEYINVEERFGYWKDAAVRLEGAAVWNFTVMFLNFWNSFRPMEEDYRPFRPTVQAAADGVVQPYSDSPLDEERLAESVYRDILDQAQDYVYIFTPYLAIGEDLLNSLKLAAKRGVDVRLVLPGIPDKKIVFRLSRSYYLPLLRAGVKVYEFTPGFIHSKCYVSDDRIAVVGSINMDYRSLYLHFECGTLLMGGSQVAAVRADAEQTFGQCHRITLDDCRTSLLGTLLDDVLRLVSPLL